MSATTTPTPETPAAPATAEAHPGPNATLPTGSRAFTMDDLREFAADPTDPAKRAKVHALLSRCGQLCLDGHLYGLSKDGQKILVEPTVKTVTVEVL